MVARLLVALALLALTAQATTCNYECQMRRDYRWVGSAQADGDFSYSRFDSHGPANWGSIDTRCNGLRQSPVDLTGAVVDKTLAPLQISYTPALNVALTNTGLGVKLSAPADTPNKISAGPLSGSYNWLETHFHSYSEHTINGGYFPLEAHFVHINSNLALRNTSEELSVIGVFYAEGTVPNTFLAQFVDTIFSLDAAGKTGTVAKVDFSTAFGSKLVYYTYLGSLTTPNCRESVTWIVLDEVQTATGDQIQKISSRLPDYSYRPLQSLNGRTVRTTSALAAGSASFSTSASGSSSTTSLASTTANLNFAGLLAGVTP